jgi:hypothetical protein
MKFDFLGLRKSLQSIADATTDLSRQIQVLRDERLQIQTAFAAKSDVRAAVVAWADSQASAFRPRFAEAVQKLAGHPSLLAGGPDAFNESAFVFAGLGVTPAQPHEAITSKVLDTVLFALLKDRVMPHLLAAVEAAEWEEGLTLAERTRRLAEIDALLAKRTAELKSLQEEANSLGVVV